ncbi:B12-binding domain-containing radical SAM protein [Acidobacteriota bacterium]
MQKCKEKILLAILPFWDPLIPPMGMSSIKSYLQKYRYHVKTVDANVHEQFRQIQDKYFNTLKSYIPKSKWGNIYSIGHQVWDNHTMAHFNIRYQEVEYTELVKILVERTFFCQIDNHQVNELALILDEFYVRLERYVLELLEKEKPGVLGLSVFRGTLASSLFAFKLAKEKFPSIMTVMGGGIFVNRLTAGSENLEYLVKKTPYLDKIIVGEGELLFLKLLEGELSGTQKVYTLADIKMEAIDISALDAPDFSDFDLQHYVYLAAYGSRSCPFQCGFCSEPVYWGKYREKNIKQVIEHMVGLSETYGSRVFLMTDSLLNPFITDLATEFSALEPNIYWDGFLRADQKSCSADIVLLWRRGGFYRARMGLESGSQRILELMDKRITPGLIKQSVSNLAYAGIKTTTFWMVGYPGETEEDFLQTLALIEELKDDIYEADCNPFMYFHTGQVNADQWMMSAKVSPLYPEKSRGALMVQSWVMEGEPSREETYRRVYRFMEHLDRLSIPNPYTLQEIYKADERWKQLHKNAVPSLLELRSPDTCIGESQKVTRVISASNTLQDDGDWF